MDVTLVPPGAILVNLMLIFARGRRAFSIAAILMLLTAVAHTAGNVEPLKDPDQRLLVTQMAALHVPFSFNLAPSFWEIYRNLMFTMSITFAGLGMVNLALSSYPEVTPRILRRVSFVNAVWVAAFVILAAAFQVLPAILSGLLIFAAIGVSLL